MSGISTIVFNGSNAYELSTGHKATSWPQGAVGIEQVSAGVQLRSPTAGAGMILRVRAIAESGLLISELSQTHILTEQNNWQRAEKTFTLPAGTVKLELRLISVGGAVLFAQPKLANGSAVGAYATNFAPQLTMITPTGIYTGTVTAEQIILTGGERLPDRLLTLNASIVSLRQGVNNSDAKIATLTADMLQFSDTMSGKTSKLTAEGLYTSTIKADQITGGSIRATKSITFGPFTQADKDKIQNYLTIGTPLSAADRARYDVNCDGVIDEVDKVWVYYMEMGIRPSTVERTPTIRIEPQSADFTGGIYFSNEEDADISNSGFYMANGTFKGDILQVKEATADTMKAIRINLNGGFIISNWGSAPFTINDGARDRLTINKDSSGMTVNDSSARLRMAYDSTASYLRAPNGNMVGVDNSGVYKIISGTKTYL